MGTKTNAAIDGTLSTAFDSNAPSNGFLFTNELECSAILSCEIEGKFVPIYTSHAGTLTPGSSEVIIPDKKVYVWFSDDPKSSTLIETMGHVAGLDFNSGGNDKTITFGEAGVWTFP